MTQDGETSLWRQPRSVYLVAFTEFWERFSYYGLVALLVLFLTGTAAEGGLGWRREEALQMYGIFAGLAFCLPAAGGWIADRLIGERAAVLLGGLGILAGNLALFALNPSLPDTVGRVLLFAGLAAIALGTGLLKPAISTLVGRVYDERPGLPRSRGYTIFMMCIYMGGVTGTLLAGAIGELAGFRWGFLVSALGMAVGLTLYVIRAPQLLGNIGKRPSARPASVTVATEAGPAEVKPKAIPAILLLIAFSTIYATAFFQKAGVLTLMIKSSTDRTVAGFEIPASTFLTVSTLGFVVFAPLAEMWMARLAKREVHIDPYAKQITALLVIAIGYAFFLGAATVSAHAPSGLHGPGWIIAGYLCFSIGDVLIWPVQISTISRLAPPRLTGFLIGLWYVSMGVGNVLAGFLGVYAQTLGFVRYFSLIQFGLVLAAALLFLIRARSPDLTAAVRPERVAA